MKNLIIVLPFLLLISCSVQKRKYQNGYYVDWHSKTQHTGVTDKIVTKSTLRSKANTNTEPLTMVKKENEALSASSENNLPVLGLHKKNNVLLSENDSCDVLIFKDGSEIRVKIIEVSFTEVKYKKCGSPDGPNYINRKSELFMIKYANGTREVVRSEPKQQTEMPVKKTYKSSAYQRENHPLAIASLISGILSLVIGYIAIVALGAGLVSSGGILILPFLAGLIAVITGRISIKRIKEQPDVFKGKGMAVPGFIMGLVVVCIYLLILFLLFLYLGM